MPAEQTGEISERSFSPVISLWAAGHKSNKESNREGRSSFQTKASSKLKPKRQCYKQESALQVVTLTTKKRNSFKICTV